MNPKLSLWYSAIGTPQEHTLSKVSPTDTRIPSMKSNFFILNRGYEFKCMLTGPSRQIKIPEAGNWKVWRGLKKNRSPHASYNGHSCYKAVCYLEEIRAYCCQIV